MTNESRLGQVFLNLLINAAQATSERQNENSEIRVAIFTDATGNCAVEVADTGPGMSADVLRQLFTPFFTTKPVGVGTGLGLSICHRIITDLGGSISVSSELGVGTTFRVLLPPAAANITAPNSARVVAERAQKRGRVLVIDDDPMVTKAVHRTLASEHEVVAVSDAFDALQRLRAGERFDVILCDVMMPRMTGMDLFGELAKLEDGLAERMIFLTGGVFTAHARAFLDQRQGQQVDKPFEPQALRARINSQVQQSFEREGKHD